MKNCTLLILFIGVFVGCTTVQPSTNPTEIATVVDSAAIAPTRTSIPTLTVPSPTDDSIVIYDPTTDLTRTPRPTLPPLELPGTIRVPINLDWPFVVQGMSSDGEVLVALRYPCTGCYGDVFVVDLTTWESHQLTDGEEVGDLFCLSDGRIIGFRTYNNASNGIWLINADGTGRRFLNKGHVATWSLDGQKIAVAEFLHNRNDGGISFTLRILDPMSGSGDIVFQQSGLLNNETGLAWSPDGQHLAFAWEGTIHILDLETLETAPLMGEPHSLPRILGWTSDGKWLAVTFATGWRGFVRWDGACWVTLPEVKGNWHAFAGQGARFLVEYGESYYLIDLREAFGPDFPKGVLSCP